MGFWCESRSRVILYVSDVTKPASLWSSGQYKVNGQYLYF